MFSKWDNMALWKTAVMCSTDPSTKYISIVSCDERMFSLWIWTAAVYTEVSEGPARRLEAAKV